MLFGRTMPTRVPKRISTTERSCFFNPFVRTADGNRPVNVFVPVVNYPLTVLCHLLWFALLAGLTALMLYLSGVRRGSLYYRWNPSVAPERTKPDRRETTAGS